MTVTEVDRSWPTQVDAVAIAPQSFAVVDRAVRHLPAHRQADPLGHRRPHGHSVWLAESAAAGGVRPRAVSDDRAGLPHVVESPPGGGAQHPVQTLVAVWLALSLPARAGTLLVAAALGYCLPVMGVSLAALLLVDVWRWRGQRQSHRDETPEAAARRAEVRVPRGGGDSGGGGRLRDGPSDPRRHRRTVSAADR